MVKRTIINKNLPIPTKEWGRLWMALEKAAGAFQAAADEVETYPEKSRMKTLLKYWDKVIDEANNFEEAWDKFQKPFKEDQAIEIQLPWETDTFKDLWKEWKLYLQMQHGVTLCGITEKKSLEFLKECTEGNEDNAKKYLDYAMRNLYRNFFKVNDREAKQNYNPNSSRKDSDYE